MKHLVNVLVLLLNSRKYFLCRNISNNKCSFLHLDTNIGNYYKIDWPLLRNLDLIGFYGKAPSLLCNDRQINYRFMVRYGPYSTIYHNPYHEMIQWWLPGNYEITASRKLRVIHTFISNYWWLKCKRSIYNAFGVSRLLLYRLQYIRSVLLVVFSITEHKTGIKFDKFVQKYSINTILNDQINTI